MSEQDRGVSITLDGVADLLYEIGMALLLLGILACFAGTVAEPIEAAVYGESLIMVSDLAAGAGGMIVGYGATLIAISRLGEVRAWIARIDPDLPILGKRTRRPESDSNN
ncbi:hypothetical protein [Halolamina salifodinae]|uniref:Uncharacterized protein n=1 Tax=Halolamina salifodinae TaxID=1202767 RepID=A0A8T4GXG3_9EURY|nr:hypothetical protein [Halolamina salifodinae]MBP1985948.1 hypothetical protein [Halolamina salifodinae]